MADLPRPVLARRSPALRASGVRRLLLVLCGVMLAGALLVVAFNLDGPEPLEDGQPDTPDDVEEYSPRTLTGDGAASQSGDPEVIFESGAWIEVADANGRLVQMYKAERLEPQADSMIDLLEPVAVMFLSQGRVLTLEGNFCRAKRRSDNDIIESGRISGDVKIRMFDPEGDETPKYATAPPSVYIETSDAQFDNITGEITCPGDVLVRTDTFEFRGRNLLARYDEENGLQFLRAEETLQPIRIASNAVEEGERLPGEGRINQTAVENIWPGRGAGFQQDAELHEPPGDRRAEDAERPRRRRDRGSAFVEPAMQLYRATFEENVHIWRGHEEEEEAEQVVLGDEMRAIFTLDNSGLEADEPRVTRAAGRSSTNPGSHRGQIAFADLSGEWRDLVLVAALASVQDDTARNRDDIMPPPADDDLRITHDGPLTIVPIDEPGITLANEDDVHLEVEGAPARLIDRSAEATADCGLITYAATADHAVLIGNPDAPLHFESPELIADGERFEYGFASDRGAFIGAGTMQLYRTADDEAELAAAEPQADRPQRAGEPSLTMAWIDGVDLYMTPRPQDGSAARESRLEEAIFRGGVSATEDRFVMKSDRLRVDFDTASEARDEIELIEASGAVDVRGLDARGGRLTSNDMRIDFERDGESGPRRPTRMTATGDAHLEDPTQAIDAQLLIAHLVPVQAVEGEAGEAPGRFGEVEVDVFYAEDDVRIALDDGTRASGNQLTAKVRENVADLVGAPVIIDGGEGDVAFHAEGDKVHIDRLDDGRSKLTMSEAVTARIINKGPVRGFDALAGAEVAEAEAVENIPDDAGAMAEAPAGENELPEAPSPQVIDVSCTDRLEYLEGLAGEADTLELFGTVRAKSTAALEDSSVEGEYLRLDFEDEVVVATADAQPAEGQANAGPESRRTLRRMIAKGDAKLESRSWLTAAREESGLRIVYVSGDHVDYDQRTMTLDVPGAGDLLIVDQRIDGAPDDAPALAHDDGSGFRGLTGKGKTVFKWAKSMRTQQLEDGLFAMHLDGDAVMLHLSALGRQDDASLTAPVLDVVFGRRGPEEQVSAMDFGGAMELRRFDAIGAVHLAAMRKTIDAMRINYDAAGQMAEIFGSRANPAEIMVENARAPQRAEKFIWDLRQDKVTIIRAVGGASQ